MLLNLFEWGREGSIEFSEGVHPSHALSCIIVRSSGCSRQCKRVADRRSCLRHQLGARVAVRKRSGHTGVKKKNGTSQNG